MRECKMSPIIAGHLSRLALITIPGMTLSFLLVVIGEIYRKCTDDHMSFWPEVILYSAYSFLVFWLANWVIALTMFVGEQKCTIFVKFYLCITLLFTVPILIWCVLLARFLFPGST